MVVVCPYILMPYRTQLSGPRFPPVKLPIFNDLACILSTQSDENRPILGLPVPPSNKPGTHSSRVGLEFTLSQRPTASLRRARPSSSRPRQLHPPRVLPRGLQHSRYELYSLNPLFHPRYQ